MLVAGKEAQLVLWMKSLGNAQQAGAFPLQRWVPVWLHPGVAEQDLGRPHSPTQLSTVKASPGHRDQGERERVGLIRDQEELEETGKGALARGTVGTGPQSSQPVRRH